MDYFAPATRYSFRGRTATLAEHLGYSADDRLVIIGADDFGLHSAVNWAIRELIEQEAITSSSIMPPAEAFVEAAASAGSSSKISCGVHLTLTSDFQSMPISPICGTEAIPSLVDGSGCFRFSREEFFRHASPDDAEREAAAQIELALANGVDVTHLDSHEGTMQLRAGFAEAYIRLGAGYRLPIRMASAALISELGLSISLLDRAHEQGLHFPDNLVYIPLYQFSDAATKEDFLIKLVEAMPPGVTEFYFHPARVTDSFRQLARSSPDSSRLTDRDLAWKARQIDYEILAQRRFAAALTRRGVISIGYGAIRDLARSV